MPSPFIKYKNYRGSYNYLRIKYELTPLHVLCYDKHLESLKRLCIILINNKVFIPPRKDSFRNTVFDISKENKFILTILLKYNSE